ncbi:MAG: class I mannose-6-phosphate isomerase, partial [Armatimonadetes bacterium]|nr:class I mannose-6-phosphate isomerase [Armatimonadota bacterium]
MCKLYDRPCVESAEPIGESWDVSTWPRDPGNPDLATVTQITNGPLAGTPLDKVVSVPVVVKLLDAAKKLSVQAHPVTKDVHKDEMWYILHADPGAYLFCGLKEGVDKEAFCELIHSPDPAEDEVLAMLNRADDLKPGMHYNVPTGTVHAVGPGLVAFEISEQTQVTYRLFDYNRGRALHLDEGCRAVMAQRPDLPVLDKGLDIDA